MISNCLFDSGPPLGVIYCLLRLLLPSGTGGGGLLSQVSCLKCCVESILQLAIRGFFSLNFDHLGLATGC